MKSLVMDVQVLLGLLIAKFRVGKGEKREKPDVKKDAKHAVNLKRERVREEGERGRRREGRDVNQRKKKYYNRICWKHLGYRIRIFDPLYHLSNQ